VSVGELTRSWTPPFPLDLRRVLGPVRHGARDPTMRTTPDGTVWRASNTLLGPGTLALRRCSDGRVTASAWGPGGEWLLDGLPALLGADDDDGGFVAHHPLVAHARRRLPDLRIGATRQVWDMLMPAILEQKVAVIEAHRSWLELCRRFGSPAPGPVPAGLRLAPNPAQVRCIPDWEWHLAGVDHKRRRAILAASLIAHRLEGAVRLGGLAGRNLLCSVPGIGVWTAAETAQRAWGDPDAVSVGDLHLSRVVGWTLLGRPLDDDGMLEVLAPYAPQRQRAVRYIAAYGRRPPRRAPKAALRDYRAM
jgi:3-methyladenine DNA glycosylase/8-oxoguanine DNA glycosylase